VCVEQIEFIFYPERSFMLVIYKRTVFLILTRACDSFNISIPFNCSYFVDLHKLGTKIAKKVINFFFPGSRDERVCPIFFKLQLLLCVGRKGVSHIF